MAKRALFRNGRRVFRNGRAVFVTVGEEGDCECCGGAPAHQCNDGPCIANTDSPSSVEMTIGNVFASSIAELTSPGYYTTRRKPLRCDFTGLNGQTFSLPYRGSTNPPNGTGWPTLAGVSANADSCGAGTSPECFMMPKDVAHSWWEEYELDFCAPLIASTSGVPACNGTPGLLYDKYYLIVGVAVACEGISGGVGSDQLGAGCDRTNAEGYRLPGFPRWGTTQSAWPTEPLLEGGGGPNSAIPCEEYAGLQPAWVSGESPDRCRLWGYVLIQCRSNPRINLGLVEWSARYTAPVDNVGWGQTVGFSRLTAYGVLRDGGTGSRDSLRSGSVFGPTYFSPWDTINTGTGFITSMNIARFRYASERCWETVSGVYTESYIEPFLFVDNPGSITLAAP